MLRLRSAYAAESYGPIMADLELGEPVVKVLQKGSARVTPPKTTAARSEGARAAVLFRSDGVRISACEVKVQVEAPPKRWIIVREPGAIIANADGDWLQPESCARTPPAPPAIAGATGEAVEGRLPRQASTYRMPPA